MKIFATSDIHNNKETVEKLKQIDSDVIIICGDFDTSDTLALVKDALSDKKWYYIRGNMDGFEPIESDANYLANTKDGFVPFEWICPTPFNTYRERAEEELTAELAKLSVDKSSIIVAHCPPFGTGDHIPGGVSVGSKAILEFIETKKPKLYLCGHIHEDNTCGKIGDTLVFNCANDGSGSLKGWYVDTETLEYEKVSL